MHQPHLSWCSVTCNYTKHTLLHCLLQLKTSSLPFILSFRRQTHAPYLFCCFQTFKYVRQTLVHAFLPLKTSRSHGFLHFNLEKHHSYFFFSFLTTAEDFFFLLLILRFLNATYIHCTFLVSWQNPKIQLLPFGKHFDI